MELKDFVKEALSQISAGVEAAQDGVRESGGFANPAHRAKSGSTDQSHFGVLANGQNIFLVDFDVSVTVVEETENNAEGKLQVASLFKIGGKIESATSNASTHRISFKVPLGLPVDAVSEDQLKEQDKRIRENRRKQTKALNERNRSARDGWGL